MATTSAAQIVVVDTDGRVHFQPGAAILARLAAEKHQATCRTCRHAEQCETGAHLTAASQPDRSWIPTQRTGD